jgi:hypothetical protein
MIEQLIEQPIEHLIDQLLDQTMEHRGISLMNRGIRLSITAIVISTAIAQDGRRTRIS